MRDLCEILMFQAVKKWSLDALHTVTFDKVHDSIWSAGQTYAGSDEILADMVYRERNSLRFNNIS